MDGDFIVYSWNDVLDGKFPGRTLLAEKGFSGTALTVGGFDGVHLGHMALLDSVLSQEGLLPGIVTFSAPPASVTRPASFCGSLYTLRQRLDIFRRKGFGFAVVIDFSDEFGRMEGNIFLSVLKEYLSVAFIAEGPDFRCGYRGSFGMDSLRSVLPGMGVVLAEIPPVIVDGVRVSSTRIRDAVRSGCFARASELLGRSFALDCASLDCVLHDGAFSLVVPDKGNWQLLPPDNRYDALVSVCLDGCHRKVRAKVDVRRRQIEIIFAEKLNSSLCKIDSVEFTV